MTSKASGNHTATLGASPDVLVTVTDPGVYLLTISVGNLQDDEIVDLEATIKVRSADTLERVWRASLTARADAAVTSEAIPIAVEGQFTLKQTNGTARAFSWNLLQVDA